MKTRDVVFYSEGAKMAGTIYLPDDYKEGEKRAAVLCNSGWTCMKVKALAMSSTSVSRVVYLGRQGWTSSLGLKPR